MVIIVCKKVDTLEVSPSSLWLLLVKGIYFYPPCQTIIIFPPTTTAFIGQCPVDRKIRHKRNHAPLQPRPNPDVSCPEHHLKVRMTKTCISEGCISPCKKANKFFVIGDIIIIVIHTGLRVPFRFVTISDGRKIIIPIIVSTAAVQKKSNTERRIIVTFFEEGIKLDATTQL